MKTLPSPTGADAPVAAASPTGVPGADPVADERRMPFSDHLTELRLRLRNSVGGLLIATGIAWIFRAPLFALMAKPLIRAWADSKAQGVALPGAEFVFTSPLEPFMVLFKLALLAAIFLASPIIFHQLWQFVAPGLYRREKRYALVFIGVSVFLFIGGATFAYTYVLPASYKYFLGYSNDSMGIMRDVFGHDIKVTDAFAIRPMLTMEEYFGLTSMLLLVFGLVFELPLALSVLAMLGIVSPGGLWRFNRYAVLIFFVLGAVLTPGDLVVGQIAMGLSLTVLYNISILVALIVGKKRREAEEAIRRAEDEAEARALVHRP